MATDEAGRDESGQAPKLPPDARLDSLEQRLERAQRAESKRTAAAERDPTSRTVELLFGHLVGAPFGGGLIGWGLDYWLGTFPLMFLVMLFFGFGVGVRNVMRISRSSQGKRPGQGS